jgi:hypothetical protein
MSMSAMPQNVSVRSGELPTKARQSGGSARSARREHHCCGCGSQEEYPPRRLLCQLQAAAGQTY